MQNEIARRLMRMVTKDDYEVGVQFVNHEYDYGQNWTTQSPFTN